MHACVRVCARVIKSLKKRVVVKACAVSLWSEMDPFDLRWTLLIWDGPFRSEMDPFDLRWTLSIWDGPFWSEMSCLHRTSYEIIKDHIMSNITSYVWSYWDLNVQSLHCKRLSIMWNRLFDQPRHYVTVIEHRWKLTRHDDHRWLKLNGSLNVNHVVPQFILIHCTWI